MRVGERSVRGLARKLSLGPDPRQIYPRLVSGLPAGGETHILQLAGWSLLCVLIKKTTLDKTSKYELIFMKLYPYASTLSTIGLAHGTKNVL